MNLLVFFFIVVTTSVFSQTLTQNEALVVAQLDFSWAEKRIESAYGSVVKIEVDSISLAGDPAAILYIDSRGAKVLANAISKLCTNATAKQLLLNQKLNKVVIRNIRDGKYRVEMKDGVLTMYSGLSSEYNYFGELELRHTIESML
jgi:hypothetical protein